MKTTPKPKATKNSNGELVGPFELDPVDVCDMVGLVVVVVGVVRGVGGEVELGKVADVWLPSGPRPCNPRSTTFSTSIITWFTTDIVDVVLTEYCSRMARACKSERELNRSLVFDARSHPPLNQEKGSVRRRHSTSNDCRIIATRYERNKFDFRKCRGGG